MKDAFMRWLLTHSQRFHQPPCNIQLSNHVISFNLTGITPVLAWEIYDYHAMLIVYYQIGPDDDDTFWDGLVDFDIATIQSATGKYYCDLCEEQHRDYYPTRLALWESHCFENILNWSNQHITLNKVLVLFTLKGRGCTWAKLIDPTKPESKAQIQKEHVCKVIPVLANPPGTNP